MAIISLFPILAWLVWRAVIPYMLCRDVETGSTTKDALFHLLLEAALYMAVSILILFDDELGAMLISLAVAMFLIGLSGAIRTAIAFIRIKKASNKALQTIGAETAPQSDR